MRPERQPYFPTPAHQFVWRNWDLVPAGRIAATLDTSAANVRQLGQQMYLRPEDAAQTFDARLEFSVLRRNWFFVPREQIVELTGSTLRKLEALLDHDAFYRGHLGTQPDCERIRWTKEAGNSRVLHHFRMKADLAKAEEPFGFEARFSSALAAQTVPATHSSRVTISYPYFCPYGDILSREEYQRYYPLALLQQMRQQGVTSIWLHALLRSMIPGNLFGGVYPVNREALPRLRWIIDRCATAGLGVYVYLNEPRGAHDAFFQAHPNLRGAPGRPGDGLWCMCTSEPQTREFLTSASASLFREIPGLEGVILITASENPTNCYSLTRTPACPRCSKRTGAAVIAETVSAVSAGVHQAKPAAKVIAWDWSWGIVEDDPQAAIIGALPADVILQVDFERGSRIERLGVGSQVDEYSISVPGPSPRASAHIELARNRSLPVMAKAQIGTTWELPTIPFLPVPDLIMEKKRAFERNGIRDGMLSWTLGGCPSMNWQLLSIMNEGTIGGTDPVLILAERRYGPLAASKVRAAWRRLSDAFRNYPFSNGLVYSSFVLEGPALRLFHEPSHFPPRILNSFDSLRWTQPFGPEKVARLFGRVGIEWQEGVQQLKDAMPLVRENAAQLAEQDLRIAEAAGLYFDAIALEIRFYLLRDRAPKRLLRQNLQAQLSIAERFLVLCRQDSRIGFEASIGYTFLLIDIREKIAACRFWLEA